MDANDKLKKYIQSNLAGKYILNPVLLHKHIEGWTESGGEIFTLIFVKEPCYILVSFPTFFSWDPTGNEFFEGCFDNLILIFFCFIGVKAYVAGLSP